MMNIKKSNAILEYGILIVIVIAALTGVAKFLERHVKAYVKNANDSTLKRPIPFLWQGAVTITTQNATTDRWETYDGEIQEKASADTSFTSIQAPVPPYIDVAGLHVQDAPDGSGQQKRNPLARRERNNPRARQED